MVFILDLTDEALSYNSTNKCGTEVREVLVW